MTAKGLERPGRARFPRSSRLLKPFEFKRVFKNSTAASDRYLKVLGCYNECSESRLGMAVSRQVDKHAVGRNRIKRVIRESFRLHFKLEESEDSDRVSGKKHGIDLVVLPRRECATISNSQLFASIELLWSRVDRALAQKRRAAVAKSSGQTPAG